MNTAPQRIASSPDEPQTLVELFERVFANRPNPKAFNYKRDGAWVPVASDEFLARARRLALGLYALGVRYGDKLALFAENCPEWTLADAACLLAGTLDVPIYSTQAPPQVQYILKDSGAQVLFVSSRKKYDSVVELLGECPDLAHVIFFDPEGAAGVGALTLAEVEERGRKLLEKQPDLIKQLSAPVKPDDLATLIYTSGTTGEPKGVMLTHANIISNMIDGSAHLQYSPNDSVLSVLPYSHVYERVAMYMHIYHGISVYYAEAMDKIGQNLREVSPTIFVGVPRLFEKMYEGIAARVAQGGKAQAAIFHWAVNAGKTYARHVNKGEEVPFGAQLAYKLAWRLVLSKWLPGFGGRIRFFVSGGAALSQDIGYIFLGAGIPILQGYGLTETSPVITASGLDANRIGASGRPIKNVEVRIAEDGEIEARGPNIMRGYYNKPDATRDVFTADGFFKTGDIGRLDADGFLYITDRKKELFKTSGGKYIAPQPLEQLLKESRFINQAVLVGNERKFPAALIVPDWTQIDAYLQHKGLNSAQSRAQLCQHPALIDLLQRQVDELTPHLAKYEKIKKVALLEHELTIEGGELTPTLKLKRRVIDEKYKAVIDRLYAAN